VKNAISAGLITLGISAAVLSAPAEARCEDSGSCAISKTFKVRKHASAKRSLTSKHSEVVAMIKTMAPHYGVPTWFALRIANVESNYNPRARGAAGEYGVYQLKCATARGIGFRGDCSQLLNPHTNVQYGLKHLSMAMKLSRGNLRLAASKHNGGLGRKRLVPRYVSAVF